MNVEAVDPLQRGERVCDRCTVKKTKCNRQKPSCSRCADNGVTCTYSAQKRKPGPPKGYNIKSRRRSSQVNPRAVSALQRNPNVSGHENTKTFNHKSVLDPFSPEYEQSTTTREWRQTDISQGNANLHEQSGTNPDLEIPHTLSYEAEFDLLNVFLDNVQPHYPLFQKSELLQDYNTGQLPRGLVCAIGAVSASLSTNPEVILLGTQRVTENYALVVREVCSPILISDAPATINDLRTLFLLALYEFRSLPNRRAWTTIGHLVRLCYHYGIHQVDNLGNCAFFNQNLTTARELESWRYLWWSTYILDCCCNTTVATPSNVDLDSLCTAFPSGTIKDWTNGSVPYATVRKFLSKDIEDMSDTVRQLTSTWLINTMDNQEVDINFVVRIINTSHLISVCDLRRAMLANPFKKLDKRWQVMSAQLTAFRLSLPARYHDPQRRISSGETKDDHALRLIVLLEFGICNLLLWIPRATTLTHDDAWFTSWEASMEVVDKIVDVIRQWDSLMWYLTDPPVAYIIFIAACMLHLNSNLDHSSTRSADLEDANRASWKLCKLFLQQLGEHWLLPKALSVAVEKFRDAVSYPISLTNASELLKNIQKPLGFKVILEHKLTNTDGHYYLPSPSFSEAFEAEGLQDWLALFDQDQDTFIGSETLGSLDMVQS